MSTREYEADYACSGNCSNALEDDAQRTKLLSELRSAVNIQEAKRINADIDKLESMPSCSCDREASDNEPDTLEELYGEYNQ